MSNGSYQYIQGKYYNSNTKDNSKIMNSWKIYSTTQLAILGLLLLVQLPQCRSEQIYSQMAQQNAFHKDQHHEDIIQDSINNDIQIQTNQNWDHSTIISSNAIHESESNQQIKNRDRVLEPTADSSKDDSSDNYSYDILDQLEYKCQPMNCKFNCCDEEGNCPESKNNCYFYKCENFMCPNGGCCIKGVCRSESDCSKSRTFRYIIMGIVVGIYLILVIFKQTFEKFFKEKQWYNKDDDQQKLSDSRQKSNEDQFISNSYQTDEQQGIKNTSQKNITMGNNNNNINININNNIMITNNNNNNNCSNNLNTNINDNNNEVVATNVNNNNNNKTNHKNNNNILNKQQRITIQNMPEEDSCNIIDSTRKKTYSDYKNIFTPEGQSEQDNQNEGSLNPPPLMNTSSIAHKVPKGVSDLYKSKFF